MPKKKTEESQAEQSKRFQKEVRETVNAGVPNPTEANGNLERFVTPKDVKPNSSGRLALSQTLKTRDFRRRIPAFKKVIRDPTLLSREEAHLVLRDFFMRLAF